MSCNVSLTTITRPCSNNALGLTNLYLCPPEYVTAMTLSAGEITAVTMSGSATFTEFEFAKRGANYTENATINADSLAVNFIQTITVNFPYREKAKRQALELITAGVQNLYAIVKDYNGKYWLFGRANYVNASNLEGGSENGMYTLTLTGDEATQAPEVSSSVITNII